MNLALFDLDQTLISGDSDVEWPKFLIRRGLLDSANFSSQHEYFCQRYLDGTLDLHAFLDFQLQPLTRFSRVELEALHAEYMEEHIRPMITQRARNLLAQHADKGDTLMIITATNRFITGPIAVELGVSHLIAVELEEDESGRFTGKTLGTLSFREGKVHRLKEWLQARGETLSSYEGTFFYSDSHNDIPLLSYVTHPIAVDPDETLRAHASKQGWPIISLRD